MMQVAITSPAPVTTYHLVSDNNTVVALIGTLATGCPNITNQPLIAKAFSGNASDPQPESTVQYYRASSVALTLDGYNNTAALSDDANLPATPLPTGIDQSFLNCLNQTIGDSVPLVDAAFLLSPNVWLMLISIMLGVRNML